ncbi:unnamed protein product [Tilletia caries]|nr:unnamed protein product [Tilletia caries]
MQVERAPSCGPSEGQQPPAKRPRLSKSQSPEPEPELERAPSPPATAEPPSSSAFTIPTSSEQAVAHSLSDPQPPPTPARPASPQQEEEAASPPPPTAGSDFDDLDWDWLDNGDELEKSHGAAEKQVSKGKGKAPALPLPSDRQNPSTKTSGLHASPAAGSSTHRAPAALATPVRPAQVPAQVFFQTASHKKVSVSDIALREAMRRFEAWEAEEEDPLAAAALSTSTTIATPRPAAFKPPTIAATRPAQPISRPAGSSREIQTASFTTPNPPRFSSPSPAAAPQPVAAHTPLPQRFHQPLTTPASTLRRPPLAAIENQPPISDSFAPAPRINNVAGAHSPTKIAKSEQNSTLTPKPHLSTGLRRSAAGPSTRARTKFSTPFKKGIRPDASASSLNAGGAGAQTQMLPSPVASSSMAAGSPVKRIHAGINSRVSVLSPVALAPAPAPAKPVPTPAPAPTHTPIFDLTPPSQPRLTLRTSGILPESVSQPQAESLGAPSEIFVILKHPDLAKHYVFDDGGVSLGPPAALEMLRKLKGVKGEEEECLNLKWVQNHWGLVLWKLAGLVRHRPEEVFRLWTWTEMCRQLRYRYEREINRAERSAIKRIQEHDASASSSMILCVRAVLPGAPYWTQQDSADDGGGKSTAGGGEVGAASAAYTLELTDGWYRIRASVDPVLGRAIERKRIKAGVKIAIRGARLHSGHEGTHVLEALEKSGLSLAGNSTSLARWDARLGFSRTDFLASLRSLNADGGCVACMDIVLTKVHPRGYVDVTSSSSSSGGGGGNVGNARSESEELEAVRVWEGARDAAQVKVGAEMEVRAERWEEVKELVEEWGERLGSASGAGAGSGMEEDSSSGAVDEACDRLLTALPTDPDPRKLLKTAIDECADQHYTPASLIARLQVLLRERVQADRDEAVYQAQQTLAELCPPRRTRSFRVIRFVDAAVGAEGEGDVRQGQRSNNKLKRSKRMVQLTLWDAVELDERLELVEGGRYLQSWRGADVAADAYLCTRRNTTWQKVD